jgi:acyl-coenzyme A thioesterase PaaI-like protein
VTSRARVDASKAVRDLAHAIVASDIDDPTLERVAVVVREIVVELEGAPRAQRAVPDFVLLGETREASDDPDLDPMSDRAVAGSANPTSVHFETRREGEDTVADVWFGPAFVGAPGRVHGGMVAAVFDDVTGFVLADVREPGFTGRLVVNYRAPVPIETAIEFRARRRSREGRKLFVEGEAKLGGRVLATAEALFVLVDAAHFATDATELLQQGETS